MAQMLDRMRAASKWVPDGAALAEAHATQKGLHGASRLAAREAAWLIEASMGADGGVAATRLQAAHRGRAGRDKAEAERARRTAILANGLGERVVALCERLRAELTAVRRALRGR